MYPLDTLELLREAKRLSRRVKVYARDDGRFEGDGVILDVDEETVSLFEYHIGVVHFLRENVHVYFAEDAPAN